MKHGEKYVFYNNLYQDEIESGTRCGIHAWADHGIGTCPLVSPLDRESLTNHTAGRGVLIDYWSYAGKHNKTFDPNTTHSISVSEILDCAKAQGTTFQYGDILMVRSGWINNYNRLDQAARDALDKGSSVYDYKFVGVEVSKEMLDFLYNNYFAAVAGDAPAFEAWPTPYDWNLHFYLLPRWGSPIGEMFDLEKLAETCRKHGRYEFFFTSSPANVPGVLLDLL